MNPTSVQSPRSIVSNVLGHHPLLTPVPIFILLYIPTVLILGQLLFVLALRWPVSAGCVDRWGRWVGAGAPRCAPRACWPSTYISYGQEMLRRCLLARLAVVLPRCCLLARLAVVLPWRCRTARRAARGVVVFNAARRPRRGKFLITVEQQQQRTRLVLAINSYSYIRGDYE